MEYNDIHSNIQSNDTHTYLPECWAGLIPLKAEFYKALAHYHAAKSIVIPKALHSSPESAKDIKMPLQKTASFASSTTSSLNSSTSSMSMSNVSSTIKRNTKLPNLHLPNHDESFTMDDSVSQHLGIADEKGSADPVTLKRAYLKESLNSHEEAERLQRMCRELKNKSALTKVLSHTFSQAELEHERLQLIVLKQRKGAREELRDDIFLMEAPELNPSTKFTLSLTGPDFTSFKVEDPFKKLGPMAIFSARRHWTAPRSVRLLKGHNYDSSKAYLKTHMNRMANSCHCNRSICGSSDPGVCEICSKYINTGDEPMRMGMEDHIEKNILKGQRLDKDNVESFGFHVRGDAPVIISYVETNSLADVSGGIMFMGSRESILLSKSFILATKCCEWIGI